MKKNKDTYDKILWECFKLFLQKGYKEVTIPDIENAIGMTRGAVFYYVKDKNELFRAIIDRYLLEKQNINTKIEQTEETGLLRFIIKYVEGINNAQKSFYPLPKDKSVLFSYMNLTYNAILYYEGFEEKAMDTLERAVSLKILTVLNSLKSILTNTI